jgi:hypothetical protein
MSDEVETLDFKIQFGEGNVRVLVEFTDITHAVSALYRLGERDVLAQLLENYHDADAEIGHSGQVDYDLLHDYVHEGTEDD